MEQRFNKDLRHDMFLLVDMYTPEKVFEEVKNIMTMVHPAFDISIIRKILGDMVRLFTGKYKGFKRCNTEYHDLKHTTDVFLAITRLIHGYIIAGKIIDEKAIEKALISALMHDTGYIQNELDDEGTGAKYTSVHIERSIEFIKRYFKQEDLSVDVEGCARMILATDLHIRIGDIPFGTEQEEVMARALFAADMLGQMADRIYLEKLLFLYREFSEGQVMSYHDERDLLNKTIEFYSFVQKRIAEEVGDTERYLGLHFKERWEIDIDLYSNAIENNIQYLKHIIADHQKNHRNLLKRDGMVKRLCEIEKTGCSL